jgi:hypothetical protein
MEKFADDYIPAALRPFTIRLGRSTFRVKMQPGVYCIYMHGRLLGILTEGTESVYFKSASGRGKLYPNIEVVDALVREIAKAHKK